MKLNKTTPKGIKTIIVGVDFSKYSKSVVEQARALSKNLKIPLVFVHVFEDPIVSEVNYDGIIDSLKNYYYDRLKSRYKIKTNESIVVRVGQAYEKIIEISKKFPNPLIVVGHRGNRSALSRMFLGSTAESLALSSPCPVWIYRGQKNLIPHKMLIPCDFSERTHHTVKETKNLNLKNINYELYHVYSPPIPILDYPRWAEMDDILRKTNAKLLADFKKKYTSFKVTEAEHFDVVEDINNHSKKYDLVAISPRHHKGLLASFGSVTSKVVRSGRTSVLVVP